MEYVTVLKFDPLRVKDSSLYMCNQRGYGLRATNNPYLNDLKKICYILLSL